MQLQLMGYGPDLDPTTPGVIVDMDGVIPTQGGFRVLEAEDAHVLLDSTYTLRTMAVGAGTSISAVHAVVAAYHSTGTASTCTLIELGSGTGQVRGTYTAETYTVPVMFRQFDSDMFAARRGSPLKRAARDANFSDITGAPSCEFIESTRDFLIAFNTLDGFDWHCCAIGDGADWTPSISTQCVRGEFFDKAGRLVCATRSGEYVVVFTRTQTYLGRYVGSPEVWQWEQISRDVGCVGPEAACETPYGTCWIGRSDIWVYDGQSIVPLNTAGLRQTMFRAIDTAKLQFAAVAWDRKNGLLWVAFPENIGASPYAGRSRTFAYHFETKRWVKCGFHNTTHAFNQLATPEYRGIGVAGSAAEVTFDDFLYASFAYVYRLYGADRTKTGAYVQTGLIGGPRVASMVRSVRPVYIEKGSTAPSAVLSTQVLSSKGGATATQTAVMDADFKWQFRQTGRWHSARIGMLHTDTISALDVDVVPMGAR